MSASEGQPRPTHSRWRAPAIGAVTGLAVAAAIVVPSAVASGGGATKPCVAGKSAPAGVAREAVTGKVSGEPANGVSPQFLAAIAQLQQAGTITAGQARTLDADIESGSIDPKKLVADGVVTAAQMHAVNDRLIAVKTSLVAQAHAGSAPAKPGGS